jgi:hypothetical protein
MRTRLLSVLGIAIFSLSTISAQTRGGACDRACLTAVTDQYLAAMVAHDAKQAPFAPNIKYTENAAKLPLTDGLWFTSTGLTDYKIYIADPQAGAAGFIGVIHDHNLPGQPEKPTILALRLKVVNRRIAEAEAVVVRGVGANNLANLQTPRLGLMDTLPVSQRRSREELIKVTNLYFDGIEQSTGSIVPFDDACNRLENRMRTAGPPLQGALPGALPVPGKEKGKGGPGRTQSCADGFNSGVFAVITSVRPRRVLVVDEEKGLTFGVFMFQHRGLVTIPAKDGGTRPAPYFNGEPVTMPMAEMFKIKNGNIHDVEAIGVRLPYGMGSGWE